MSVREAEVQVIYVGSGGIARGRGWILFADGR
jgi:hypothetical protein